MHGAKKVLKQLLELEAGLQQVISKYQLTIKGVHPNNQVSALNLLQYLWLRKHDITKLQDQLHQLGLSSLASSESHVHRQIQEILLRLGHQIPKEAMNVCDAKMGAAKIRHHATALFGSRVQSNEPAFMVTLDAAVATDIAYLANLLQKGMQIARINCAHDNEKTWKEMIKALQEATKKCKKPCKVYMDLAGPKFRILLFGKQEIQGKLPVSLDERIKLVEPNTHKQIQDAKVIACHQPGVLKAIQPGSTVLIDDGIIEAAVESVTTTHATLHITRISGKPFIKSGKGINFPGTYIEAKALTNDDLNALSFVEKHADLVGYSFVKYPEDIRNLWSHLGKLQHLDEAPWLIIKIETPEAVKNLPSLLLRGLKSKHVGVMIARGDLAVEIGFERLSEIQEEILWLCEAAHIPVIWATQVLDQLNKTGVASRSEITDAYKAAQAECIMINKGAYTAKVLHTLKDLAKRSRRHHLKKRYALPPLTIARQFIDSGMNHARVRKNPPA